MSSADQAVGLHLRRTDENVDEISDLSARFGGSVGVAGVLEALNRKAERTKVPGKQVTGGFRWNAADSASRRWWPQGITTSADASDTEDIDGHRVLATSWYAKEIGGINKGSRVTFVDIDTLRYRHVLLVQPEVEAGKVVMRPLLVHAGGLVWCGPYLHVAGTSRGLFTCLVDDIIRVTPSTESLGYSYVLPVRFSYDAAYDEGVAPLRYSFLSLDRSVHPPELVAGEYGLGEMTRRLVRYPLDPESFHLFSQEDGTARPVSLDDRGIGHMQGAVVVRGRYYVTTSRGRWKLGHLHVGEPGAWQTFPRAIPVGPEDISYWPSQDRLWSLTEYPGRRFVFAMDRAQFD